MTKVDYLNAASDLRRIANWVAREQKEKLPLILKLWENMESKKEISKVTDHFVGDIKPEDVFKNKKLSRYFAEQVLMSSLRLQSQSVK